MQKPKPKLKTESDSYLDTKGRIIYTKYITSRDWKEKSKQFYQESGKRCSFTGMPTKRYNSHHMNYKNLGSEVLWRDIAVFCPFVHQFIIHGLLSGFRRPSQQKSYPNFAQKTFHFWCCQPHLLRRLFLGILLWHILGWYGVLGFGCIQLALIIFA